MKCCRLFQVHLMCRLEISSDWLATVGFCLHIHPEWCEEVVRSSCHVRLLAKYW